MVQLYRYRQVNIVRGRDGTPQVKGMEEVCLNGRRQVRYFGDEAGNASARSRESLIENSSFFPLDGFVPAAFLLGEYGRREPRQREFVPAEVIFDSGSSLKSAQPSPLQEARQGANRGFQKLRRMVSKLPQALKSAWRELS